MIDDLTGYVSDEQRTENRSTLARLREMHGPQHWLTVVSGVTASAYRPAGMTGEEFGALVRDETGLINIRTRRKPLMRLCKGFDGCGGVIKDEGTWTSMFIHFPAGCYADFKGNISGPIRASDTARAVAPRRHTLRSMPDRLLLRHRPRCHRHLLAMTYES